LGSFFACGVRKAAPAASEKIFSVIGGRHHSSGIVNPGTAVIMHFSRLKDHFSSADPTSLWIFSSSHESRQQLHDVEAKTVPENVHLGEIIELAVKDLHVL
jgi:hypothetical protein